MAELVPVHTRPQAAALAWVTWAVAPGWVTWAVVPAWARVRGSVHRPMLAVVTSQPVVTQTLPLAAIRSLRAIRNSRSVANTAAIVVAATDVTLALRSARRPQASRRVLRSQPVATGTATTRLIMATTTRMAPATMATAMPTIPGATYDAGLPFVSFDQPAPVVEGAVGGDASYCAQRYRSWDPASGTYLGFDGMRHPCP